MPRPAMKRLYQGSEFALVTASRLVRNSPLTVVGLTALALGLGMLDLGAKSLWLDEGTSVAIAGLDWSALWREATVNGEVNMSLYHVLLHLWLGFGQSEAALRSLSVLAAVATVPIFHQVARRLFDNGVAAISTTLLVLNAFFIQYAQEARGYSLVLLLVTCSSYLFLHALDRSTWRSWLLYGGVSAFCLYVHFFAALVLAAHLTSLLVARLMSPSIQRRPLPVLKVAAAYGVIAAAALPILIFVFVGDRGQISWIPEISRSSIVAVFQSLSGNDGLPLLVAYFLGCVLAFGSGIRMIRSGNGLPLSYIFVAAWLALPVGVTLAASLFKPLFLDRYLIVVLPALVLAVGFGISRLRTPGVRAITLVAVLILAGQGLIGWYRDYQKEDWRDAAAYVLHESEAGDAVFFYRPRNRNPFAYYVGRFAIGAGNLTPIYPSVGWGDYIPLPQAQAQLANALKAVHWYRRIWLVLRPLPLEADSPEVRELFGALNADHREISRRSFVGIQVRLYEVAGQ
jgi:mannosyltransferase